MTLPTGPASWDLEFESVAAEYEGLRRAGNWVYGPQDFFGILKIGRSELAHSAILAWLMNPDARHGFGRRFLDVLVSQCWPDLNLDSLRVRSVDREVQGAETRADIIVWGDIASLVFEVKVDAGEELRQCDRLYERFSSEPGARFIYLTPPGPSLSRPRALRLRHSPYSRCGRYRKLSQRFWTVFSPERRLLRRGTTCGPSGGSLDDRLHLR